MGMISSCPSMAATWSCTSTTWLASGCAVARAAPTLSSGLPGAFSTSAASGQAASSTEPSSSPPGTMATSTSASLRVGKQCAMLGSS